MTEKIFDESNLFKLKGFLEDIKKDMKSNSIFIDFEYIDIQIKALEKKVKNGETMGELAGKVVLLKDNISTKDLKTTAGSKMLENFVPIYDAHIVKKLKEKDALILGKASMNEFGLNVDYNNDIEPFVKSVEKGFADISIGSDDGGSLRKSASLCGLFGYVPSYEMISNYGLILLGDYLNRAGIVGKTVEDIILTINSIGGNDFMDSTSNEKENLNFKIDDKINLKNLKFVSLIKNKEKDNLDESVNSSVKEFEEFLIKENASFKEKIFDLYDYSASLYSSLLAMEAVSSLGRYDGLRYGYQVEKYNNIDEFFLNTRKEVFSDDIKELLARGSKYLYLDNRDFFTKVFKVREHFKNEINNIFKDNDFIILPTENKKELNNSAVLNSYPDWVVNTMVNFLGLCSITVPIGKNKSLFQIISKRNDDERLLNLAYFIERRVQNGI